MDKSLDRALWTSRFGRGYGPFVRETIVLINFDGKLVRDEVQNHPVKLTTPIGTDVPRI